MPAVSLWHHGGDRNVRMHFQSHAVHGYLHDRRQPLAIISRPTLRDHANRTILPPAASPCVSKAILLRFARHRLRLRGTTSAQISCPRPPRPSFRPLATLRRVAMPIAVALPCPAV